MKKYIKPELFYERFELTQHIADCYWEVQSADQNVCKAYAEDGDIFPFSLFVSAIACEVTTDDGAWEDYCIHNGPDGTLKVFAS